MDQRESQIRQRDDVPRIVPARALELAAGVRELALLGEREAEPNPRLHVGGLRGEHALELGGGLGRTAGLEQCKPEVAPRADVGGPERDDALEVSDREAELAAVTEEGTPLTVAEGAVRVELEAMPPDLLGVTPNRKLIQGQGREPDDPAEGDEDDRGS